MECLKPIGIISEREELFDFISQFLDTQIFLKKIKCLSKYFNLLIKRVFLQLHLKKINLSLQNINLPYFEWQLMKFKNRISFIKFFHTMDDRFLKCLVLNHPKIQNLDLSYCRKIKNISLLRKLHKLETLNIKGFSISKNNFLILKIINYLFKMKNLKKVLLLKNSERNIQIFTSENQLFEIQSIFEYY